MFGLRLRPPDLLDPTGRPAAFLLGEILREDPRMPRWRATRGSRYIGGESLFTPAWTDAGFARFAIGEYRLSVLRALRRLTPKMLATWAEMTLLSRESNTLKLAMSHRCDAFGVRIQEVLALGVKVPHTAVDELQDDIRTAPGAVVYRGPALA
jgi:hypothetical protein